MAAKAKGNLRNVPLSGDLHDRLRAEAARSRRPATIVARDAIEAWIDARERLAVHEAIADYASDVAGSPADLDPTLENTGIEHLIAKRQLQRSQRLPGT
jgi:predicted DNA-binding protein